MLKKILSAIAILILLFLIIVAIQPPEFTITRATTIAAPPAAVFPHVNNFHNWNAWSPWAKLDPQMKQTFEGPAEGVGATYAWAGNSDVGEGRMTITDSKPDERVTIKLEFIKPFAATNTADFTFKPQGEQTDVTWSMSGRNNFVSKAFCLFMNLDKMVGSDFEKGLAQLKTIAESQPASTSAPAPTFSGGSQNRVDTPAAPIPAEPSSNNQ